MQGCKFSQLQYYQISGLWSRSRRLGLETVSRRLVSVSVSSLEKYCQRLGLVSVSGGRRLGLGELRLVPKTSEANVSVSSRSREVSVSVSSRSRAFTSRAHPCQILLKSVNILPSKQKNKRVNFFETQCILEIQYNQIKKRKMQ